MPNPILMRKLRSSFNAAGSGGGGGGPVPYSAWDDTGTASESFEGFDAEDQIINGGDVATWGTQLFFAGTTGAGDGAHDPFEDYAADDLLSGKNGGWSDGLPWTSVWFTGNTGAGDNASDNFERFSAAQEIDGETGGQENGLTWSSAWYAKSV